jgi:hypothetical protein
MYPPRFPREIGDFSEVQQNSCRSLMIQTVKHLKSEGLEPTTDSVKEAMIIKKKVKKKEIVGFDFFEKYDEFLSFLAIKKTQGTIKNYNTLLKHLQNYTKKKRFKFTYDKMTYDFYEKFWEYLIDVAELGNNSADNQIKLLKGCNWILSPKI